MIPLKTNWKDWHLSTVLRLCGHTDFSHQVLSVAAYFTSDTETIRLKWKEVTRDTIVFCKIVSFYLISS